MIIVDVEATGTDFLKHSLISIGAVDFEHPENQFYGECRAFPEAHVEKDSLVVIGKTHEEVFDPSKQTDKELVEKFIEWAGKCEERTLAGHNTSFDRDFIERTAMRYHLVWPWALAHRTLDLHSVAYLHMIQHGITPPITHNHSALNSERIAEYVGLPNEPRPHIALNGALWEAECFSRIMYGKNLLPQFVQYPIVFNK